MCFREALSNAEKSGNIQEKGELQGLLIDALDAAGDDSAAEKLAKKMMADFPRSPVPFFKLGNQYRAKEKYADAVKMYLMGLEIHPGFTNALVNLAMCYRSMRKFDDSIAAYRRALIESPERADIYVNFGVLLDSAGKVVQIRIHCAAFSQSHFSMQIEESEQAYRKAIKLDPYLYQASFYLYIAGELLR